MVREEHILEETISGKDVLAKDSSFCSGICSDFDLQAQFFPHDIVDAHVDFDPVAGCKPFGPARCGEVGNAVGDEFIFTEDGATEYYTLHGSFGMSDWDHYINTVSIE